MDDQTTTTPSAPALTPEAAEAEIHEMRTSPAHRYHKAFTTPGHPAADKALAHLQMLYAARNGAPGRVGQTFRESGDPYSVETDPAPVSDPEAGGPAPIITDPVLRESLPSAPMGAKWDEARIERLSRAAQPEGLSSALPAIIGVVKSEYERGCPEYTAEGAYDALAMRYGDAAEQIVLDADQLWKKLPHSEQAWLTSMRLHRNPKMLFALAHAWRNRRTGQEETDE
jgi:hypothetical protein